MPVPPLSAELTRLILSLAAKDLEERERRENCLRSAQVYHAWNVHATELAWQQVSLWQAAEKRTRLVDHLLTHTHLLQLVKTLDFGLRTHRQTQVSRRYTPPSSSGRSTGAN